MSSEYKLYGDDSLLLTSEDKANGFSIVGDESHSIPLFKQGRPMAWFATKVVSKTETNSSACLCPAKNRGTLGEQGCSKRD